MAKIAILGGGIAGLTAAWELTATPELRSQNKVTIYQLGFRLGGKLASGRKGPEAKNVEHGLHVWFGFYENAFGLLRSLYDEWPRDPRGRFQRWTDVVEPRNYMPVGYRMNEQWALYPQLWFANADRPGDGRVTLTLWGVITELLSALERTLFHPLAHSSEHHVDPSQGLLHDSFEAVLTWLARRAADGQKASPWLRSLRARAGAARARLGIKAAQLVGEHPRSMRWALAHLAKHVHHKIQQCEHGPADAYFDWLVADYVITVLRGLLNPAYGLLEDGNLDRVNDLEFLTWMRENGASEALLQSTYMRLLYEAAFQYVDGDRARPNGEAGTCLRMIFRMTFTYKGAFLWALRGGMGDVLIAPLYETLRQRGVEFRFFHRVERLCLSPDQRAVEAIDIGIQARLKRPYEPLITIDYGPAWPDEPRWEFLEDGERLRRAQVNFESKWEPEPLVEVVRLTRGRDFDQVVLAMALGAFKPLNDQEPGPCAELIAANPRFARMVHGLGIVPSQALQLWMNHDLRELGFDYQRRGCQGMRPAAVDAPDPFSIWADMTPVLAVEQWRGNAPRSSHYLCGVLATELYKEPRTSHDVPARAHALVRASAVDWLERYAGLLWPGACKPGTWMLDWNALTDPEAREGRARLDAQYFRANVEPTECCVGSTVNSSALRLGAAESGFENLYLAGAWTKTPVNVECVEGAVMSGMLAARAICGLPRVIVGEHWLQASEPPDRQVLARPRRVHRQPGEPAHTPSELPPAAPSPAPDDDEPMAAQ